MFSMHNLYDFQEYIASFLRISEKKKKGEIEFDLELTLKTAFEGCIDSRTWKSKFCLFQDWLLNSTITWHTHSNLAQSKLLCK